MNLLVISFIIAFIFILLETPLFTVIAGLSLACLYSIDHDFLSLQIILIEMNRLASMPVLIALPLFTLAGCVLSETGAPKRIMNLIKALTGRLPGGVAIAALGSCAFFTALTGASGVTIVAMGSILYPVLRNNQYSEKFSLGLLTTSGSLGLLFPPSLPVILYGVVAQVDISKIFRAALIPGILLIAALSVFAVCHDYFSRRSTKSRWSPKTVSCSEIWTAFRDSVWDWPVVIIIVAGVYGGVVSIAEVSAVILVYIVLVECFILKELDFIKQLPGIMVESAILSGAIIVILGVALGFTGFLIDEQIPNRILEALVSVTQNRYVFLAGLNVFLLVVGCVMDIFSAIIIIVPIMVPVALMYGIDPVHLCIIFLVNLEIGYATPPVGINLFISSLKFQKPVTLLYRASVPYLLILLLVLIGITYVPTLSLLLVR